MTLLPNMRVIIFFVLTVPIASVLLGKQNATKRTSCYPNEQTRRSTAIRFPAATAGKYYLSFPVRSGVAGQLRYVYEDLNAARLLEREIFLPMLEDHKVYKEHSNGYHPFSDYFDVNYMRQFNMKVIGPGQANRLCGGDVYMYGGSLNPRLERYYKQYYKLNFIAAPDPDNQRNDRICIAQYREDSIANFPAYPISYANGQGYSLRAGDAAEFKKIWATFKPSEKITIAAENVLAEMPSHYNCVHLRRGDFELHCDKDYMQPSIQPFGPEACFQSESHILTKIQEFTDPSKPIYVATDSIPEAIRLLAGKRRHGLHKKDTKTEFVYGRDETTRFIFYHYHNVSQSDLTALVDQIVCANADEFIGNRFSGFTSMINNMRYECDMNHPLEFWDS